MLSDRPLWHVDSRDMLMQDNQLPLATNPDAILGYHFDKHASQRQCKQATCLTGNCLASVYLVSSCFNSCIGYILEAWDEHELFLVQKVNIVDFFHDLRCVHACAMKKQKSGCSVCYQGRGRHLRSGIGKVPLMCHHQLVQQGFFLTLPGNSKVADLRQAFNFRKRPSMPTCKPPLHQCSCSDGACVAATLPLQ